MKIIIDHQIFSVQEYGGVSKLFAELYKNLKKMDVGCEIPLVFSNNEYLKDKKVKSLFKKISFPGKLTLIRLINKFYTIRYLRNGGFDVFHPTYFDDYFIKYIGNKPFILTVYDLIHEKFYSDSIGIQPTLKSKRNLIQKTDKIISISQKTKNDLVDYYKIKPSKIEVIYPANSLNLSMAVKCNVPGKYILFVGSRKEYKNFDIALRAMNGIEDQIFLVCAGGGRFTSEEEQTMKRYKIRNRVIQINVSDSQLAYCYKNAKCFVFPSLYEGFGIPILEAFACNCPVVLSDIEVFREVAGNAALYVNPKSADTLTAAINSVINNWPLRNKKINLGKKRLKLYSWSKMAQETLKIYRSIT